MRVTPEDVEAWIAGGEGRRLELKRGLPRPERTARVLCAFANTSGGILLVGVTDGRRVVGVPRPAEAIARLRSIAESGLRPPLAVVVRAVAMEGGTVVCCSVPLSAARPHAVVRAGGGEEIVVRVGSSNRAADGATRRALEERPARERLDELERNVLDWVGRHTGRGGHPDRGATVASFAKAHNVGLQRARRKFVRLERAGRIVGHGSGARRAYATP